MKNSKVKTYQFFQSNVAVEIMMVWRWCLDCDGNDGCSVCVDCDSDDVCGVSVDCDGNDGCGVGVDCDGDDGCGVGVEVFSWVLLYI